MTSFGLITLRGAKGFTEDNGEHFFMPITAE